MSTFRVLILLAALFASGCRDSIADAEAKADFLEKNGGSLGEVCDAKREVQRLAAEARDPSKYDEAKLYADISCMSADQHGRHMPADDNARDRITQSVDNLESDASN